MANKKEQIKQAARAAAKTGTLTSKQINQLNNAGVKSSVIQSIKATNKSAASAAQQSQPKPQSQPQPQPKSQSNNTNPLSQSRYGIGAQKAAQQNYKALKDQGVTDAFNPGKPGSAKNIMADGFVGKKELNKFANLKGIDASQARRRLTSKGASFTAGANKRADSVFGKNNPMLAMMINSNIGENGLLMAGMKGTGKGRQMQNYKDSTGYDYKNRLPGDVFTFRPNSGMVDRPPVPNVGRLNDIFGNPMAGDKPNSTDAGNTTTGNTTTGTGTGGATDVEPIEPVKIEEPVDPGAGMMSGGGLGSMGANKLLRAKSRLQRLGILGQGTGLLGRGLQYGNALNK